MSADTYTEVTRQGWGSRIGGSFKGIIGGLLMVLVGAGLLWFNEGRAVKTAQSLKEGAGVVVTVSAAALDPTKEGRLVHMTGEATTSERLTDPEFGISVSAVALRRSVEMYQWQESKHSETKKKLGGGEETVTTYTYDRGWFDRPIASSEFKKPEGHANPTFTLSEGIWRAKEVNLGAHTLSPGLVQQMTDFQPIAVTSTANVRITSGSWTGMHLLGGSIYLGSNPNSPQVGDVRVSFSQVKPGAVSIVARQVGSTFEPYATKAGRNLEMLEPGAHAADAMFKAAQASNKMLTWILRGLGFFLIFIGLVAVFKPLSVLADVVPFIGNLVGAGTGIVAFMLALVVSLTVIAVAWFFFRPVLAIGLLVVAAATVVLLVMRRRKRSVVAPTSPPPLPGS